MNFWNGMAQAVGDLTSRILMVGNPITGIPEKIDIKSLITNIKSLWISQSIGTATDKAPSEKVLYDEFSKIKNNSSSNGSLLLNASFEFGLLGWVCTSQDTNVKSEKIFRKTKNVVQFKADPNKINASGLYQDADMGKGTYLSISFMAKSDMEGAKLYAGMNGLSLGALNASLTIEWKRYQINVFEADTDVRGFVLYAKTLDATYFITDVSVQIAPKYN